MPRLARCKQCSRTGSLAARKRISRLPRAGYLANPRRPDWDSTAKLVHAANKISFGSSTFLALAQTLVETDQANESDWIAAGRQPSTLVEQVLRRYLADRGQSIISEHLELSLTLGEAIVDNVYTKSPAMCPNVGRKPALPMYGRQFRQIVQPQFIKALFSQSLTLITPWHLPCS